MKIQRSKITENIKFQVFIVSSLLLFFYKLFLNISGSMVLTVINEILLVITVASLSIYIMEFLSSKKILPLSMVMNIGILSALIFFLVSFSDIVLSGIFSDVYAKSKNPGLVYNFITFFYVFIILGSSAYFFVAFRELYFLKQKRNAVTYFNTMVVFFILTSLSTLLDNYPGLAYIKTTFLIVSIILIAINSIKISWIAFLLKKEKLTLLILSVIIAVLFVVNLINNSDEEVHRNIILSFSPALNSFLNIIMLYGVIYFSVLFFTTLFHIPTAEAFDRKAQEVTSLQYFSNLITQVLDFNDLAETVTDIAIKVCNANAAWIAWKENNEYKIIANKNISFTDADLITAYFTEKHQSISNTQSFSLEHLTGLNERFFSIFISPLKARNEIGGYLIAAWKADLIFDDEDRNAINTFSEYASVSIDNSRLVKESIEKERLEKELDLAREVQRKILPEKNPEFPNLKISSVFIPAFEVGGDYYDFFEMNENELGFVVADVSGKGISAAFIMAEVKGIFESLSSTIKNPKDILVKANEILKGALDRKNFVSAVFGIIDLKNETLTMARAGHCPILLIRDNVVNNMRPSGLGLGLNFSSYFSESLEEVRLSLKENDMIVLYTDGITEAKNSEMEDFGNSVFEKILLENADESADVISKKVIREVTLFSQNNSQHDDITLVIFKWKPKINFDGEEEWQISAPQLKIKVE